MCIILNQDNKFILFTLSPSTSLDMIPDDANIQKIHITTPKLGINMVYLTSLSLQKRYFGVNVIDAIFEPSTN